MLPQRVHFNAKTSQLSWSLQINTELALRERQEVLVCFFFFFFFYRSKVIGDQPTAMVIFWGDFYGEVFPRGRGYFP